MTVEQMKKTVSFLLALVFVLAMVPMKIAPKVEAANMTNRNLTTLKKEKSTIAPGITQEIGTVRKQYNGQQLVYYLMKVDHTDPYAQIHVNYKDNDWQAYKDGHYGLQTVKAQMDAAQVRHSDPTDRENYIENFTVVGGINGTGYNMSTGNSNDYILMMEGQELNYVNQGFFGVTENGKAMIGWTGAEYEAAKNNKEDPLVEALGQFSGVLIKEGVIQENCDWEKDASKAPNCNARTAVGVTQEGDAFFLVVDGKQAPYSEGCDMYELALILKKAGCYNAFNWDGGGSTTYVSRPEGEETYRVVSKPCDGSPRAVATSLYVATTAPDDSTFKRTVIDADAEYITPGGTVNLTAKGVTAAGSPIEIPEGVTWSCDDNVGKLNINGNTATFVANDEQSDEDKTVTISMLQGEESVGTFTIHVVKPNVFKLTREKYMVPFGKSMPLEVYAAYKTTVRDEEIESEVTLRKGDVTFALSANGLGSLNDNLFTAHAADAEDAVNSGNITATLNCNNTTVSALMELGRGSEMVIDFEEQADIDLFTTSATGSPVTISTELASEQDGHVHGGSHSLRLTIDCKDIRQNVTGGAGSCSNNKLTYNGADILLPNAVGIGMWVWIPDEEVNYGIQPAFSGNNLYTESYQKEGMKYDEGHWEWVYVDTSEFTKSAGGAAFKITKNDRTGFWTYSSDDPTIYEKIANKLVFYVDDLMVDYSPVTPDREAPTIGDVTTGNKVLDRGTTYNFGAVNTVSFYATATEDSSFNATGIDPNSAVALIDGNKVNASFTNGQIVVDPVTVADGVHTLKLYISDKEGNTTNQTRQFKVDAGSKIPTIQVVARKTSDERVLMGGVCYADVIATDVSKVQKVELVLDLINNAQWEIMHAEVDTKFTMSEPVIDSYENIATVTFTRTKAWEKGDSETIASLPIRAWNFTYDSGNETNWTNNNFSPRNIELDVDKGTITYIDGYTTEAVPAFGMEHLKIETEMFGTPAQVHAAYPDNLAWHSHIEAKPVEDKQATCTENGYENRNECPVCHSPVNENDWGEVISALGHDYKVIDGVMKCSRADCGVLFNGVVDGKTYVNGKTVEGWQDDGTYYVDGKPLDEGLHKVKDTNGVERWYLFGENGVCGEDDRDGYTGYYTKADDILTPVDKLPDKDETLETTEYYYIEGGLPYTGWLYFRKDGGKVEPDTDKPTDTPEDTPDPKPGTGGETSGGTDSGVQDKEQQQAILDIVAYHVHKDGRVHSVTYTDTRKCVESGNIEYKCNNCGKTTLSERLWWVGHDWDENHVCKREDCKFVGKNIAEASLNIMGKHFEYVGGGEENGQIRAAVYVYHDGKQLSVRSDKNGHDGYVTYSNNYEIGVATVHIRGEGDYYGELTGTFEIVPQSVTKVTMTQTAAEDVDHVKVTLTWAAPLGAEFYDVWRYDYIQEDWINVGKEVKETTFSEELEVGTDYDYRVASRAKGLNEKGEEQVFYSVRWSDSVNGTIRHSWGPEVDRVDATCQEEGHYKHTCALCGYEETVTLPKLEHKVTEWNVTKEATTAAPGSREGVCELCHETIVEEIPQLPPVYVGTGNTTSPDAEQETVTNPDGSKTTTTTTKDGTVTETTEQVDGTVTEKTTNTDGASVETTTTPEGVVGTTGKDASGNVTNAEVTVPQGGSEGVVKAPVEVPSAGSTKDAPQINVHVQGEKSVKMEVPVTDFGPGTVAVVVHPDGTEEVVRDCVVGEDGVILNVEGDVTLKIVENSAEFKDIERVESWAGDAIEFTSARELFSGTGNNNFQPDGKMSRGALVTLLYRLSYEPDAPALKFGDVDESSIYADAVAWADSNSIVSGYGNGTFMPDNVITREQLVTLIYQYAQFKGVVKPNTGNINTFTDADKVSNYAKEAMTWAIGAGIVSGQGDNTLNPTGSTTRAQTAVILMKLCDYMAK